MSSLDCLLKSKAGDRIIYEGKSSGILYDDRVVGTFFCPQLEGYSAGLYPEVDGNCRVHPAYHTIIRIIKHIE